MSKEPRVIVSGPMVNPLEMAELTGAHLVSMSGRVQIMTPSGEHLQVWTEGVVVKLLPETPFYILTRGSDSAETARHRGDTEVSGDLRQINVAAQEMADRLREKVYVRDLDTNQIQGSFRPSPLYLISWSSQSRGLWYTSEYENDEGKAVTNWTTDSEGAQVFTAAGVAGALARVKGITGRRFHRAVQV